MLGTGAWRRGVGDSVTELRRKVVEDCFKVGALQCIEKHLKQPPQHLCDFEVGAMTDNPTGSVTLPRDWAGVRR